MAITLENSFFLEMTPDQAWALLNDVQRIAPCVPGAQLTEIDGNNYHGKVKVKLGPITAQYKGVATITSRDDAARRLTLSGKGKDVTGAGTAGADLVMLVTPEGNGARVVLNTDVQLTGKVAQLGRGVMQDVSARLIDQFVDNLKKLPIHDLPVAVPDTPAATDLPTASETLAVAEMADPAAPAPTVSSETETASITVSSGPRKIDSPEPEAVDLIKLGGGALLGRDTLVNIWMVLVLVLLVVIALK